MLRSGKLNVTQRRQLKLCFEFPRVGKDTTLMRTGCVQMGCLRHMIPISATSSEENFLSMSRTHIPILCLAFTKFSVQLTFQSSSLQGLIMRSWEVYTPLCCDEKTNYFVTLLDTKQFFHNEQLYFVVILCARHISTLFIRFCCHHYEATGPTRFSSKSFFSTPNIPRALSNLSWNSSSSFMFFQRFCRDWKDRNFNSIILSQKWQKKQTYILSKLCGCKRLKCFGQLDQEDRSRDLEAVYFEFG